jgi:hypothetical protein
MFQSSDVGPEGAHRAKPIPSSIHDPPSVNEGGTAGHGSSGNQQELNQFEKELASEIQGTDQDTVEAIKKAVQSAVRESQGSGSGSLQQVIQEAKQRVRAVLERSDASGRGTNTGNQAEGIMSRVAEAVSYVGSTVAQAASPLLGTGEARTVVQEEGAGAQAAEVVQPLRDFAQQLHSTQEATEAARNYTPRRQSNPSGNMAKGYSTQSGNSMEDYDAQPDGDEGRNMSHADNGQGGRGNARAEGDNPRLTSWQGTDDEGNAMTHNTVSGSYTTGETGTEEAHAYAGEAIERARNVREAQLQEGMLQHEENLAHTKNTRYSREYATSRHSGYQSQQLHGDAAQRGLEAARDLARHPERLQG